MTYLHAIQAAVEAPRVLGQFSLPLMGVLSTGLRDRMLALIAQADNRVRVCVTRNMRETLRAHREAHAKDAERRFAAQSSQRPSYFTRSFS